MFDGDDEEDVIYLEDVWNEQSLNRYTFIDVVTEAVTILAYEYVEKNDGKKPSKAMINEWIEKLIKDQTDE